MNDLTLVCPHCDGAISVIIGVATSANGSQPASQSVAIESQIASQSGSQSVAISDPGTIAHVFESKALEPSTKRARTYNQGYEQEYLQLWSIWPVKKDKRKGLLAWRKCVLRLSQMTGANRVDAMAQIYDGAIRYRDDPNRNPQYTKYLATWLNAGGPEDEDPLPQRFIVSGETAFDRAAREAMADAD